MFPTKPSYSIWPDVLAGDPNCSQPQLVPNDLVMFALIILAGSCLLAITPPMLCAEWKRMSSDLPAAASLSIFSAHLLDTVLESLQSEPEASGGLISSAAASTLPLSLDSSQLIDVSLLDSTVDTGQLAHPKHVPSAAATGESPVKSTSNEAEARLGSGIRCCADFHSVLQSCLQTTLASSVQIASTLGNSQVRCFDEPN
jgi:hypothetical protein